MGGIHGLIGLLFTLHVGHSPCVVAALQMNEWLKAMC